MATEKGGLKKAISLADELTNSINSAESSWGELNKSILQGGASFQNTISTMKQINSVAGGVATAFGGIIGVVPGLGGVTGAFGKIGGAITGMLNLITKVPEAYLQVIRGIDLFTQVQRDLKTEMFGLSAAFGGGLANAQEFTDFLTQFASTVVGEDFGHIGLSEMNKALGEVVKNKVPMDFLRESIETTAGSTDALTSSILQAAALGMGTEDYYKRLGDAIYGQGLSSQGAMEQMASFKQISEETGLTIGTVADAMQGLSSDYRKLGLNADFNTSIIRGFSYTMNDMGLGLENVGSLSKNLGSSIADLANNPGMAFITAQLGGLGTASGGALNPMIQMQAQLLSGEDQGEFGETMLNAMKGLIENMGGGQIITLEEAAESPQLQMIYMRQNELLKGMYGLDAQTSVRTLDLLDRLGTATDDQRKDIVDELTNQINEGKDFRNDTISIEEQANRELASIFAEVSFHTKDLQNIARSTSVLANETVFKGVRSAGSDILKTFESEHAALVKTMDDFYDENGVFDSDSYRKFMADAVESRGNKQTFVATAAGRTPESERTGEADSVKEHFSDLMGVMSSLNEILGRLDNTMTAINTSSSSNIPGMGSH